MAYLRAEHTTENFHFIMWCVRYHELFQALSPEDKASCPEWTKDDENRAIHGKLEKGQSLWAHVTRLPTPPSMDSDMAPIYRSPSGPTPPSTAGSGYTPSAISDCPDIAVIAPWESPTFQDGDIADAYLSLTSEYPKDPPGKLYALSKGASLTRTATLDTLRAEVATMLRTYVEQSTNSTLQLNLSYQERFLTTCALEHTLHPSAFHLAEESISRVLRQESYPKFLTTTYANCNNARVKLAYFLGFLVLFLGFCCFLIFSLSKMSRWYRLIGFPVFALGVYFTYSAFFGVCPVLQGFGVYQIKPWELEESDEDGESSETDLEKSGSSKGSSSDDWINRYNARSSFQHIFDPHTKIYNQRIRKSQIIINCQGAIYGIIASAVVTLIFMFIPQGNRF